MAMSYKKIVKEIHKDLWGDVLSFKYPRKDSRLPHTINILALLTLIVFAWHSSDILINQKLNFFGTDQHADGQRN